MAQKLDQSNQQIQAKDENTAMTGLSSLFENTSTDAFIESYKFQTQTITLPENKIGIIIQARTTSSRFPNKVLAHFQCLPIIDNIVLKLRTLDIPIVVSMPDSHSNDVLAAHIRDKDKAAVHRSKWEHDVLSRFKECIAIHEFDVIIRICADCPLIKDSDVAFMLDKFLKEGQQRMVWGLGCWIFTKEMLEDVEKNSIHAEDREHCGFHYMSKSVDWPDDIERLEKDG